jgi:hypothetical protein
MARLSLVAFLTLALSGVAFAAPREIIAARGTASLTYTECDGASVSWDWIHFVKLDGPVVQVNLSK